MSDWPILGQFLTYYLLLTCSLKTTRLSTQSVVDRTHNRLSASSFSFGSNVNIKEAPLIDTNFGQTHVCSVRFYSTFGRAYRCRLCGKCCKDAFLYVYHLNKVKRKRYYTRMISILCQRMKMDIERTIKNGDKKNVIINYFVLLLQFWGKFLAPT